MYRTANGAPAGLIYNIQKYTIHDGPGIRTEIFFKGCPLHCKWCSNPESLAVQPQIGVYPSKCITAEKCSLCLKVCPLGGQTPIVMEDGILKKVGPAEECAACMKCVDICPSRAIMRWGDLKTVDELMKTILEDRSFYRRRAAASLERRRVMLQWEFAALLLKPASRRASTPASSRRCTARRSTWRRSTNIPTLSSRISAYGHGKT
jgi:pyruvate formate lyase activating enzyme